MEWNNHYDQSFDFILRWSEHVQQIKNKMRSLTVLFYKIRFLDNSTIRQLYMTLCNSILLYGQHVGEALTEHTHYILSKK
ncbi:RNA-directed DNA polymerase from mobile element jockey [Aphis craccivora]|uniref:RNA-directed DNA polymerase from mobile element jockey n=1 Tax=Aphis craccivora TaxID=307492 RepID=A0A6G0YK86_APHCR|nr:RNA-directed DNA polymerase from mobile element jockey [Aphis craccivora]